MGVLSPCRVRRDAVQVVVEREGREDACLCVAPECAVAEFKAQVCAELGARTAGDWDFVAKDDAGGMMLEDDDVCVDALDLTRVELRLKAEVLAREKLRVLLQREDDVEAGAGACITEHNWEEWCLRDDAEATQRILHLVVAGKVVAGDVIADALLHACSAGDAVMVQRLVAAGVDADTPLPHPRTLPPGRRGYSPLMVAADREGEADDPAGGECCAALLAAGADPNAMCTHDGATSLFLAARRAAVGVCGQLLAHGAHAAGCAAPDTAAMRLHATSPLHAAALHGAAGASLCRLLIAHGADPNAETDAGQTPLMAAAQQADGAEACASLVSGGADPNHANRTGWTAVLVAAKYGHDLVCRRLVALGCDVDVRLIDGRTPLMLAAVKGYRKVCAALLEGGADVKARLVDGEDALCLAAARGRAQVCSRLLAHGSDVDVQLPDGSTPLMTAARAGHEDVCGLLVRFGADVNAVAADGTTPLHAALTSLKQKKSKDPPTLPLALIDLGADLNHMKPNGYTPLLQAVVDGRVELCRALAMRGADVNLARANGWTPIMSAVLCGHAVLCGVLLEFGADANARTDEGHTPLSMARQLGHDEVVVVLVEFGAQ